MPPPNTQIFSEAEIEKMRLFVSQHDQAKVQNNFDLNNPPRTNYTHQEFPRLVYHLDDEDNMIHKLVHDAADHEAALAEGWENLPKKPIEGPESEISAADAAEVADIDKKLAAGRKKKK